MNKLKIIEKYKVKSKGKTIGYVVCVDTPAGELSNISWGIQRGDEIDFGADGSKFKDAGYAFFKLINDYTG